MEKITIKTRKEKIKMELSLFLFFSNCINNSCVLDLGNRKNYGFFICFGICNSKYFNSSM